MKRWSLGVLAGAMGALFSLATAALAGGLHLMPAFPAPAGEDDFSFRFTFFGLAVVPSFAALGVWVGWSILNGRYRLTPAIAGAVLGTAVAFAAPRFFATTIEAIRSSRASNTAFVLVFVAWIALAGLGATLGGRQRGRS